MLVGVTDPVFFEEGAPLISDLAAKARCWEDCIFLQALTEIESGAMCEMLPPALHPTLPPVVGFSVFAVPDSEWGAFNLAQLRIECRSGLRPRGLLVSGVIDNEAAGRALAQSFGFRLRVGEVELERAYDETRVRVSREGRRMLETSMRAPQRIGESDPQFVSSLHPATTPRGFRLVQVDTEFAIRRAERAPLEIEMFDAEAWGEARIRPSLPLPGVVGIADITLRSIRFVCRPDVLAFEGTEPAVEVGG
ncbi:MAG: hypothetical protein CL908_23165 [Deltaproteobacteria bacterium]|nr:hypothetical protein [Deltaproteobacteria bacterium]